jgi:phosphoribosylpyrophosphate synthetase
MVDVIQFGELSKKAERIIAKEEESKKINRSKIYGYNNNNNNKGERKKSVVSVNKDNKDNSSLSCSDDDNIRRRVSASSSTLTASVKANQTFKSNAKHEQKSLDSLERRRNADFSLIKEIDLKGRRVIIVDDIITSGASMSNAATLIRSLGAKDIIAACLAIAYKEDYI